MAWFECAVGSGGGGGISGFTTVPERYNSDPLTITGSTYEGGYEPWKAFDFGSATYWRAGRNDSAPWIKTDLGESKDIIAVRLVTYNDVQTSQSNTWNGPLYIEGSNDDETWFNIVPSGAYIDHTAYYNYLSEALYKLNGSCRYIRIRGVQNFTVWGGPSCWFSDIMFFAAE